MGEFVRVLGKIAGDERGINENGRLHRWNRPLFY
jgi:hypothetical protein